MIALCRTCRAAYDDEYRTTICPHETFAANDGQNNFAHHPESYISKETYLKLKYPPTEMYQPRVDRLRKLIDQQAPPIIVATECTLVISAINRNSRWRTVWFVFKRCIWEHAWNEATFFFYKLRYRVFRYDPNKYFDVEDGC